METPSEEWLTSARKYEWLTSARKYISLVEECDCDCFLCIRGDHDEHCDWLEVEDEDE